MNAPKGTADRATEADQPAPFDEFVATLQALEFAVSQSATQRAGGYSTERWDSIAEEKRTALLSMARSYYKTESRTAGR